MDVFYYWKDIAEDLQAKRIGCFRSNLDRLKEFQEGSPELIWVFKTPRGLKGRVQLHASLRWTNFPVVPALRLAGESYMYYDPTHPDSAMFTDSSTPGAIDSATAWANLPRKAGVATGAGLHDARAAARKRGRTCCPREYVIDVSHGFGRHLPGKFLTERDRPIESFIQKTSARPYRHRHNSEASTGERHYEGEAERTPQMVLRHGHQLPAGSGWSSSH